MKEDKKDILKGWMLVVVAVVFMVGYFLYTYIFLKDAPPENWNFGTTPFVPGSSNHAVENFDRKQPPMQTVKIDSLKK